MSVSRHKSAAWIQVRYSTLTPALSRREREKFADESSSGMTVGIARITLFVPESHSLKEKRMVLRRVKDRVRSKFNAAIAEVDDNDVWQRGVVGLALVGNDRRFVESALDEVVRFVRDLAEATNVEREILTFSQPLAENDLGYKG